MGRTLPSTAGKAHRQPPGYFRELNSALLEDLWLTLASGPHPELLSRELEETPPLTQLFDTYLRDVSWHSFWNAFPWELREQGASLDELDALGLLLASPMARSRFQRFFEDLASRGGSSGSGSGSSGSSRAQRVQQALPPPPLAPSPFELQPTARALSSSGSLPQHLQVQLALLPARRSARGSASSGGGAAPAQQQPPPQPPPQQQQQQPQQQAGSPVPAAAQYLEHIGLEPALASWLAAAAAAAGGPEGRGSAGIAGETLAFAAAGITGAPAARAAARPARGSAAAAAGEAQQPQRLTGHRRSWQEACDPGPAPQEEEQPSPSPLAEPSGAAAASPAAPAAPGGRVDNSRVWRAVHEHLTSEDDDLLAVVGRLVPFSLAGRALRPEADTRAQLQALAGSRPVPRKVVQAIAARLAPDSGGAGSSGSGSSADAQVLRLTSSSGFSRRAAAAAAALACSGRRPFYVCLAGLTADEDLEAAVMRGMFVQPQRQQQQRQQQQRQQQQEQQGHQDQQGAQQEGQQPAPAAGAGADAAAAGAGAAAAGADAGGVDRMDTDGSGGDGDASPTSSGCDCIDQLGAHLTLLSRCRSCEPLLVLLDEVDAALLTEDGRGLRELLGRLALCLPSALLLVTCSAVPDALADGPLLRRVGTPVHYALRDGTLSLVSHRVLRSSLFLQYL